MATSSASAAARPQANNRLHVVRVRNKLRRLSTVGSQNYVNGLRLVISISASASDESFLFQLPNPLLQELPLRFLLGQGHSFLIRRPSLSCPAEPAVHICTG
jgi:hypothetical protein